MIATALSSSRNRWTAEGNEQDGRFTEVETFSSYVAAHLYETTSQLL
jgi:hypothetical protein